MCSCSWAWKLCVSWCVGVCCSGTWSSQETVVVSVDVLVFVAQVLDHHKRLLCVSWCVGVCCSGSWSSQETVVCQLMCWCLLLRYLIITRDCCVSVDVLVVCCSGTWSSQETVVCQLMCWCLLLRYLIITRDCCVSVDVLVFVAQVLDHHKRLLCVSWCVGVCCSGTWSSQETVCQALKELQWHAENLLQGFEVSLSNAHCNNVLQNKNLRKQQCGANSYTSH